MTIQPRISGNIELTNFRVTSMIRNGENHIILTGDYWWAQTFHEEQ